MSGAAVPVLIVKARQRMIDYFEAAGATSPGKAIGYAPRDKRLERRLFARMAAHRVFVETAPGRYWLDHKGWAKFQTTIRRRVGGIMLAGVAAVAAAVLLG